MLSNLRPNTEWAKKKEKQLLSLRGSGQALVEEHNFNITWGSLLPARQGNRATFHTAAFSRWQHVRNAYPQVE